MKLREIMTSDVEILHPDDTLMTAARKMRDRDIGFLPVFDGDQLIGVLTDRDIVMRGVASGAQPEMTIGRDLATAPAIYCYDDESVDEASEKMRQNQIRRLVILHRGDDRIIGVISLGDLATNAGRKTSGEVLQSVSEPS